MHNLRYILESELGVEHPVEEPPRILPAADSGEEIPHHRRNVSGLLYDMQIIQKYKS